MRNHRATWRSLWLAGALLTGSSLALSLLATVACQGKSLDPAPTAPAARPQAAAEGEAAETAMNEPDANTHDSSSPVWPLSCDMEVPAVVPLGEKIELVFTLHHRGSRTLWILPWQTPIEGLVASPFTILLGEKPITFTGRMVKRASPRLGEYVEVPPHTTRSYTVDLASAYAFEEKGIYSVKFDSLLFDVTADATEIPRTLDLLQSFELDCPAVQFELR